MKATVNENTCTGCEECIARCPAVFALTPDYLAEVKIDEIPPDLFDLVTAAAKACPAKAISIEND